MNIEELKSKFLNADRIISVLDKKGKFRASIVKNSHTISTAIEKHNTDKFSSFYLAKYLTSASLISSFLKGEERIILDITSDGLIQKVYAEAMPIGEVRGFIKTSDDLHNKEIVPYINGFFKLSKILYDKGEPVTGIIEVKSDLVEDIIEDYFISSEQIPTFVKLDLLIDEEKNTVHSGGIIVQSLPGASGKEITEVKNKLKNSESLANKINMQKDLAEILSSYIIFDFDIIKSKRVDFFCRCSKNNFINKLYTLPLEEIESMKNENQNELVCQFCNSHYYLDSEDFNKIILAMKARKN
ncbi:MAG: Hsp33 family molecular chaperone HslO [Ignavibacteriae bacterium]|nr:Hsp33 family molecular chaperone HslO [Ignavibacteriota bacterium]